MCQAGARKRDRAAARLIGDWLIKPNPSSDALALEVSGRTLSWPDVSSQTGNDYATDWFEQASLSSTQQLSMQQQTTCCGLKRGPKFSESAHILPWERLLRTGFNPSHLNALVNPLPSLSISKYFSHDNIWPDGMDFLTMIKAPESTQSYCLHIVAWNNFDPGLEMPYIATAISNVENMPFGSTLYAPSTNLWEMSWKNSAKQCDNVHRAGEYSDIQDCAISMSNIGCATLYSKLPTWQGVRCVPCYISYCPVYISEFYEPILAWGIEKGL